LARRTGQGHRHDRTSPRYRVSSHYLQNIAMLLNGLWHALSSQWQRQCCQTDISQAFPLPAASYFVYILKIFGSSIRSLFSVFTKLCTNWRWIFRIITTQKVLNSDYADLGEIRNKDTLLRFWIKLLCSQCRSKAGNRTVNVNGNSWRNPEGTSR